MRNRYSAGSFIFDIFNYVFLGAVAVICILPIIHIFALSLSESWAASGGYVTFWPIDMNTASYKILVEDQRFFTALIVSLKRVGIGVLLQMFLTILTAYPLSKEERNFKGRTIYTWFMFLTIIFSGGLIPTYMTVKSLNLLDSLWALILPSAIPVFNVILLLNFFRQIPRAIEESANIDGGGHWTVLWRIYVPLSPPSLATIALFCAIGHWNSWFDGIIYMNKTVNYPLQTYLQAVVDFSTNIAKLLGGTENLELIRKVSDRTVRSAQIFLGALPIMIVYPFLQRYFIKGIVIGSVKG